MSTLTQNNPTQADAQLNKSAGLPGRLATSWAMAGGIVLGGFVVALMTLTGSMSANAVLVTATGLFIVGAALGFLHGAVLGSFAQDHSTMSRSTAASIGMGALYSVPGLAVAWLMASWISMTVIANYVGSSTSYFIVGAGWLGGTVILAVAAIQGWRALQSAYARWPEWRLGTALVAASFAALLVLFLADRPMLWGLQMRVTPVGAVLLAAVATTWIAGPVITVGLVLLRKIPGAANVTASLETRGMGTDLTVGAVVGIMAGLLATPFLAGAAAGVVRTSAVAITIAAVSQALVTEVLLRLFLTTAVAWLLLQWHRVTRNEAVALAIVVAAGVQVALYLPGTLAIGFPTLLAAAGYIGTVVLLPALAFGTLYWTRGFRSALVAHTAALMVLALMAF